jgi:hypothetical protein
LIDDAEALRSDWMKADTALQPDLSRQVQAAIF